MKTKLFFLTAFFSLVGLTACDENLDQIGLGVQPDRDKILLFADTIPLTGKTVKLDSIYAKTIYGLLGRFRDPYFGEIKAGYCCQFYPTDRFPAKDSIVDNRVDSLFLEVVYSRYVGDSLAPMEVTAYPLKKQLTKNYYCHTSPSTHTDAFVNEYCDLNNPFGSTVYTARNMNNTTSLADTTDVGYRSVKIRLPRELGQAFLEKSQTDGLLNSPEALAEFFPGVYLESTFGSGNLLNVEATDIVMYYQRIYTLTGGAANGSDSTYTTKQYITMDVTKEITQLNSFTGSDESHLLNDPNNMYLKTPTGICAEITIPIKQIRESIGNRQFSDVCLNIEADPDATEWSYTLPVPGAGTANSINSTVSQLMLIHKDSVKSFFESQQLPDSKTSYFTTYNSSTKIYSYANIANVVQQAIDNNEDELKLLLLPVQVSYVASYDAYGYETKTYITTFNYMAPSGVTLKKDLEIQILATGRAK